MTPYPLTSLKKGELNLSNKKTTHVDGPPPSLTLWLQGCPLGCKGCWNPNTHTAKIESVIHIDSIINEVLQNTTYNSLTFSGGEPFWQAPTLTQLIRGITSRMPSTREFYFFCYSGLTKEEILSDTQYTELYNELHYLVSGRYKQELNSTNKPTSVASSNQEFYTLKGAPPYKINTNKFELTFDSSVSVNGYPPVSLFK